MTCAPCTHGVSTRAKKGIFFGSWLCLVFGLPPCDEHKSGYKNGSQEKTRRAQRRGLVFWLFGCWLFGCLVVGCLVVWLFGFVVVVVVVVVVVLLVVVVVAVVGRDKNSRPT